MVAAGYLTDVMNIDKEPALLQSRSPSLQPVNSPLVTDFTLFLAPSAEPLLFG